MQPTDRPTDRLPLLPLMPTRRAFNRDGRPLRPFLPDDVTALLTAQLAKERRRVAELEAELAKGRALLGEVHHRVQNQFQVVRSLIQLEQFRSESSSADGFRALDQRIATLSRIHLQLYRVGQFGRVDLDDYFSGLVGELRSLYGGTTRAVLELDVEALSCDIETAVPLGLIANELITNALKHAFPQGREGNVTLRMRRVGDAVELVVADDGVGSSGAPGSGLGAQLVPALAGQVRATLTRETADGTCVALRLDGTRFAARS